MNINSKNCHYNIIYGVHAVCGIISGRRRKIFEIYIQDDKYSKLIQHVPSQLLHSVVKVTKHKLTSLTKEEGKHQGIAVKAGDYHFQVDSDLYEYLNKSKKEVLNIFVLDQIQDPQNIGSILRTLYCFKADCVIVKDRNAPSITNAVVRASAGYSEMINLYQVTNLNTVIARLKDKHETVIIGLDSNASSLSVRNIVESYKRRVFVFGSEGFGISDLLKKNCDFLVKIPMSDKADSLNVTNAIAIIGYETFVNGGN